MEMCTCSTRFLEFSLKNRSSDFEFGRWANKLWCRFESPSFSQALSNKKKSFSRSKSMYLSLPPITLFFYLSADFTVGFSSFRSFFFFLFFLSKFEFHSVSFKICFFSFSIIWKVSEMCYGHSKAHCPHDFIGFTWKFFFFFVEYYSMNVRL